MNKSSIICKSCKRDNEPTSEFCIDCGATLVSIENQGTDIESVDKQKMKLDYRNWKMSVPYILSVCIFLVFIDLITGGSAFDWSYWAVVPILLFAVLAPYLSFKMVDND